MANGNAEVHSRLKISDAFEILNDDFLRGVLNKSGWADYRVSHVADFDNGAYRSLIAFKEKERLRDGPAVLSYIVKGSNPTPIYQIEGFGRGDMILIGYINPFSDRVPKVSNRVGLVAAAVGVLSIEGVLIDEDIEYLNTTNTNDRLVKLFMQMVWEDSPERNGGGMRTRLKKKISRDTMRLPRILRR